MIDIFLKEDVINLLKNKHVIFMGDSNIRALYKDLLCLSQQTKFISQNVLKKKMEDSCLGDKLLNHGPKYNGRAYREERNAFIKDINMSFYFLTCVYEKYVERILYDISTRSNKPDVLIINSCLWDVTRWGPNGVHSFKNNLVTLMKELKKLFPDCLVIWVTAPPIACEMKGGFLVKELQFLRYSLRFHVMEANHYARRIVVSYGFDVVDSHYHLKMQLHRRSDDGIHWFPEAVRYITNLLLTHISIAWNKPLPHRCKSDIMEENLKSIVGEDVLVNSQISNKKPVSKVSSYICKPDTPHTQYTENNYKTKSKTSRAAQKKRQAERRRNERKNNQESFRYRVY